ncbi:MAG TPA: aminoglycoside phosphotransferase family protein [Nocardioidaceae bacterium]|nr:aminoglycoside phosphotransferase family protein [Nocardioidaceae bacterium]
MLPFALPPGLTKQAALGRRWVDWLDRLPRTVADLVEEWELRYDGLPRHGYCSLIVPVRTTGGRPAVLKVALPDDENEHEHLALQRWQGNGAVLLLRADPRRYALLIERLHFEDLSDLWDVEACEIVAGLYARLHVPAPPQLRPLTSYVERWNAGLAALPKDAPMPRRLVDQAVSLAASFLSEEASTGRMIHGDLHYENVLAADREPWLVIDPKPMSGDPHYEVAPLLWNRWDEVVASGRVRDAVRRRFHAVVDAAGLDEDRARDWVVVRALHNAFWSVDDARSLGRGLDGRDREWITTMVTVAKAVQG